MIRVLASLLFLVASQASGVTRGPWLDAREPAYQALRDAANRAGEQGWTASQLRKGSAVPIASARELAMSLMSRPDLQPWYRQSLWKAFAPESAPLSASAERSSASLQALDERIQKIQARLDEQAQAAQDSVYGAGSDPKLKMTLTGRAFSAHNWTGRMADAVSAGGLWGPDSTGGGPTSASATAVGPPVVSLLTDWLARNRGVSYHFQFIAQSPGTSTEVAKLKAAELALKVEQGWLDGTEIEIGNELAYPSLSPLVFSMPAEYLDDFKDLSRLNRQRSLVKDQPDSGARLAADLYLRKKGRQGVWVFDDTELVLTQNLGYYYFDEFQRELAGRVAFKDVPLFWPFEPFSPALVCMLSNNDQATLNTSLPMAPTENSTGQALALTLPLAGGGSLYLEGATAEWQRADVALSYRDYAYAATYSQPVLGLNIVLDYQHTGQNYFPGGHHQGTAYLNDTSYYYHHYAGSALADPRPPGKRGGDAWGTIVSDPQVPTNNSEHLSMGLTLDLGPASLGLSAGSNAQIVPSGPWIASSHIIGWPRGGSTDIINGSHGLDQPVPIPRRMSQVLSAPYNSPALNPGLGGSAPYMGAAQPVVWSVLTRDDRNKAQREFIYLTKDGIGDGRLRDDSVKFLNFAQLNGRIDLKDLLGFERALSLSGTWGLRSTGEAAAFPMPDPKALLFQSLASLTLNAELPADLHLGAAGGYETWGSRQSYLPIDYSTLWAYCSLSMGLPELIKDFSVGPNFAYLRHHDAWLPGRGFETWNLELVATTTF